MSALGVRIRPKNLTIAAGDTTNDLEMLALRDELTRQAIHPIQLELEFAINVLNLGCVTNSALTFHLCQFFVERVVQACQDHMLCSLE